MNGEARGADGMRRSARPAQPASRVAAATAGRWPCAKTQHASRGFTLIEVLVALAIVAIALMAGLQATSALTRNAQRQSDVLLAHLCAENELVKARLSAQMPAIGDSTQPCEQAGRRYDVAVVVRPTPNPQFRRVDAQVLDAQGPVLRLTTIVGRY